jgi:homoserine dehydrogenase
MPIVRAIGDGLRGDRITRIVAILNGTTNAVLSRMEATGCALDEAVREAQACGLAEADPSSDLDGADACAKLAIVCALAFGIRVDPAVIPVRSCAALTPHDLAAAHAAGGAIRQIARAEFDYARAVLTASVAPELVPQSSIFARTAGPENVAVITGEHSGDNGMFGVGAGGDATAVAIASDLLAIARDRAAVVPAPHLTSNFKLQTSDFPVEVAC